MSADTERYRTAAREVFGLLRPVFGRSASLRQSGSAFDTIVDFFGLVDSTQAKAFAEIALERHAKTSGERLDDHAWWGVAAIKASQRRDLFPGFSDRFREIGAKAWATMNDTAPRVWAKADQRKYADFAPRFEGGVWNAAWTDDCNPITPCGSQKGIQSTTANGLYLVLAARLGCAGRMDCQQAAKREYGFLRQWFEAKTPLDPLLAPVGNGGNGAFLRERATGYASGHRAEGYRPSLALAGDQGLVLGGLVDLMILDNAFHDAAIGPAQRILSGLRECFIADDGTLLPWREKDGRGAPGGDEGDCLSGPGVLMRYLLYAYRVNPELRMAMRREGYLDLVRANAEKACAQLEIAAADDATALAVLTNNLATLTAAVTMLNR